MDITVNDVAITAEAVTREVPHHADAADPELEAARALAIRALLLRRARDLDLRAEAGEESEEAAIEALLEREIRVPSPTDAECHRYYDNHLDRFSSGDLVEGLHILFAVTPNAPLGAIREQAEATLKQLVGEPERFAGLAARFSNCPSGVQGGSFGQLARGDTVPEFEAALFGSSETGVLPQLVRTRFGFHIVRVARRIEGRKLPFHLARERIARYLAESVRRRALQQYVRLLAAAADITGIDLEPADSPLVR